MCIQVHIWFTSPNFKFVKRESINYPDIRVKRIGYFEAFINLD